MNEILEHDFNYAEDKTTFEAFIGLHGIGLRF